jgi:hypothetical protein
MFCEIVLYDCDGDEIEHMLNTHVISDLEWHPSFLSKVSKNTSVWEKSCTMSECDSRVAHTTTDP